MSSLTSLDRESDQTLFLLENHRPEFKLRDNTISNRLMIMCG